MSSSICTSNVTSGFIDLATFDEIEKYMYGGPDATAYFVRETRKSTWFTQVPVCLSRASGTPEFGQECSFSISRAGDYLLETWLRLQTPVITGTGYSSVNGAGTLAWTNNFMHNLIKECAITFNDLVAARFDNYHLDFWSAFTVPAGKRNGYNNMIGAFPEMTNFEQSKPSYTLNLPLPLFYTRDSGVALPTAALPYNDMRIQFSFRDWTDLLLTYNGTVISNAGVANLASNYNMGLGSKTNVWANYAIVSNDERKRMACAPRDILIEQVQTAPRTTLKTESESAAQQVDIRFSHAIKVLFFSARNKAVSNLWSNYTTDTPIVSWTAPTGSLPAVGTVVDFNDNGNRPLDPIKSTSLIYENTQRLNDMGSDYYSLVNPYYHAPVIPDVTGFHMYSYSLDFICLDPMGSTNYGKLTNVSINPTPSKAAVDATYNSVDTVFEFIVTAVNNNIIRISGGALGKHGKPKTGRCFNRCGKTIKGKHFNTTKNHTRIVC